MKSTSTEQIKRKLKVLHNKLATIGPVMRGTVVLLGSTCGNPRCKCARGQKHPQYYFSVNIGKKTKMMYLGEKKRIEAEQYSTHRPGLRPEDEAPAGQLISWHISFILPSIKL